MTILASMPEMISVESMEIPIHCRTSKRQTEGDEDRLIIDLVKKLPNNTHETRANF